jgi:hypothetical protein
MRTNDGGIEQNVTHAQQDPVIGQVNGNIEGRKPVTDPQT